MSPESIPEDNSCRLASNNCLQRSNALASTFLSTRPFLWPALSAALGGHDGQEIGPRANRDRERAEGNLPLK